MIFASYLFAFILASIASSALAQDNHENCKFWATVGECKKNPTYMLENCPQACLEFADDALPDSFYDIVEEDLDGNPLPFSKFRGKVVYIINVASQVGILPCICYLYMFILSLSQTVFLVWLY